MTKCLHELLMNGKLEQLHFMVRSRVRTVRIASNSCQEFIMKSQKACLAYGPSSCNQKWLEFYTANGRSSDAQINISVKTIQEPSDAV
jgi:hypothetical protein